MNITKDKTAHSFLHSHAEDVADGVVLSLDSKRRRIDDLGVPFVWDPAICLQSIKTLTLEPEIIHKEKLKTENC